MCIHILSYESCWLPSMRFAAGNLRSKRFTSDDSKRQACGLLWEPLPKCPENSGLDQGLVPFSEMTVTWPVTKTNIFYMWSDQLNSKSASF